MRQRRWASVLWAGGLVVACAAAGCRTESPLHGAVLEPPNPAADFELTDQSGRPFALRDTRGRVVLVYFGYTSCPDICPTTLGHIKAALMTLGEQADRVVVAMVTVDGERDTPDNLATYLRAFDESFIGLTGTPRELVAVYEAYGIEVVRRDTPGSRLEYAIDHSATLSVIDEAGLVREVFFYGTPTEHIAADLRFLLGLSES